MPQVFRTLRAGPYTRSLAYDPESDFLASMSAEGTLQIWDMADGKAKHTQKKAAPKVVIALTLATADTCSVAVSCTNYTLPIPASHATLMHASAVQYVVLSLVLSQIFVWPLVIDLASGLPSCCATKLTFLHISKALARPPKSLDRLHCIGCIQ